MAQLFAAQPANAQPLVPNYNVCPTNQVHVVRQGETGRRLVGMRWGFLPPTNVNFAPGGIAAECLAQLAADNDGERLGLASLVVNAIDPCVAYDVRMH